ncbi:MAG: hypothetical protein RBG13Loki_1150 [Promethearchaeota archaeon CR_4]|nr:MAG: hypothetical protein RBG13Loki_1150 [Candidatus Lokiarchaeota archaeon CR_4]
MTVKKGVKKVMGFKHKQSFFGGKTGMVVLSNDWAEPWIMVTFIKKKGQTPNASWEKFSEGKTLKFSLTEVAAILGVLRGEKPLFKTFHKFKEGGTPVEIRYERGRGSTDPETVVFSAGGYIRPITWPETDVLRSLLEHIFEEKIQYATNSHGKEKASTVVQNSTDETCNEFENFQEGEPDEEGDEGVSNENSMVEDSSSKNDQESALAQQFRGFCFHPTPSRVPSSTTIVKGELFGIEQNSASPLLIIDQGNGELLEIPSNRVHYATQDDETVILVVGDEPLVTPAHLKDSIREIPSLSKKNSTRKETMASAFLPDGIAARASAVKKVTEKAICVENRTGSLLWIPRSAFSDDQSFPDGPLENPWEFSLKGWFARKMDAQTWLTGH